MKRRRVEDPEADDGRRGLSLTASSSRASRCDDRKGGGASSSLALRTIVGAAEDGGGESAIDDFFRRTWQVRPRLFRNFVSSASAAKSGERYEEEEEVEGPDVACPLSRAVGMGWDGVADLLQRSRSRFASSASPPEGDGDSSAAAAAAADGGVADEASPYPPPLFFRDRAPLRPPEVRDLYGSNPFAAYLDGCSVVINHADVLSPDLASLCLDLQRSLPHAYANAYLTPPSSAAVPAHADDRDVFVVQIAGRKRWRVYGNVPVRLPYPEEQVGKGGLEVPGSVLDGPLADLEGSSSALRGKETEDGKKSDWVTLHPGDVLYMPRGYVHEARTEGGGGGDGVSGDVEEGGDNGKEEASFHATVAVATHDWTLAGILPRMLRQVLGGMAEYRRAADVRIGRNGVDDNDEEEEAMRKLRDQIDRAFELARERVTAEAVSEVLRNTYGAHNDRALRPRMKAIERDGRRGASERAREAAGASVGAAEAPAVVGPDASARVYLRTEVRAADDEERSSIAAPDGRPRGLTVREGACDALAAVLERLRGNRTMAVAVEEFRSLAMADEEKDGSGRETAGKKRTMTTTAAETAGHCDDLTLLAFARCCVEMGAAALAWR